MKYNKIFELAPEGEKEAYTDETTGEGVWMSHTHMAAVDGELTALEGKAGVPNDEHQKVVTELEAANKTIAENKTTISTQSARIDTLEAENKKLGASSSGSGTSLDTEEDAKTKTKSAKPGFFDDNHPLNVLADQFVEENNAPRISDFK